ncbi:hypothetical protein D1872_335750 [compost metagenome]
MSRLGAQSEAIILQNPTDDFRIIIHRGPANIQLIGEILHLHVFPRIQQLEQLIPYALFWSPR